VLVRRKWFFWVAEVVAAPTWACSLISACSKYFEMMKSLARYATMLVGAFKLPRGTTGKTEASTTLRLVRPCTMSLLSTTPVSIVGAILHVQLGWNDVYVRSRTNRSNSASVVPSPNEGSPHFFVNVMSSASQRSMESQNSPVNLTGFFAESSKKQNNEQTSKPKTKYKRKYKKLTTTIITTNNQQPRTTNQKQPTTVRSLI